MVRKVCVSFLLLISLTAQAQFTGMSLLSVNSLPDTLYPGMTYNIYARLQNTDSLPFTGTVQFALRNNQGSIPPTSDILALPPYTNASLLLSATEQVPAFFRILIDPAYYYTPGPETIVIWPISNKPVKDSLIIPFILPGTLSAELLAADKSIFYCVADNNRLYVPNARENWMISIQTQDGRCIAREPYSAKGLPSDRLSKGLYILQLEDNKGGIATWKYIH